MALAYILLSQLNVGRANAEYDRGHALAGGDADADISYAEFLAIIGRTQEALNIGKEAEARDPLNPSAFGTEGFALIRARRFDEAIAVLRKASALAPDRLLIRKDAAESLVFLGRTQEAVAQLRGLPPDYMFRLLIEAIIYAREGNRAASDTALQRMRQINGDTANYQYAEIYAQRGDKDQAFDALERAWAFRDPGVAYMNSDIWFNPIRSDPRFAALLRKMNFPA